MELHGHLKCCVRIDIESALGLAEVDFVVELTYHDLFALVWLEPLDTLAFFPETELRGLTWHDVGAEAMLLATAPMARVSATVRPGVDAISVLLIIFVLASVLTSILPSVNAHAVHVIIDPFSLVLAPIEPGVGAEALDFVLLPLSVVPAAVVPAVDTFAVLLAGEVLSFVD